MKQFKIGSLCTNGKSWQIISAYTLKDAIEIIESLNRLNPDTFLRVISAEELF